MIFVYVFIFIISIHTQIQQGHKTYDQSTRLLQNNQKPIFLQYSVNDQSVMIFKYFHNVRNQFYCDFDANDPLNNSPTAVLFAAKWYGINTNKNPKIIKKFNYHRPQHHNINIGVSYENHYQIYNQKQIPSMRLSSICQNYYIKRPKLMKITFQQQRIIQSNNWQDIKCRPQIIITQKINNIQLEKIFNQYQYKILQQNSKKIIFVDQSLKDYYEQKAKQGIIMLNKMQILKWQKVYQLINFTILQKYDPFIDPIYIHISRHKLLAIQDIIQYSHIIAKDQRKRPILILNYDPRITYIGINQHKNDIKIDTLTKFQYKVHRFQFSQTNFEQLVYIFDHRLGQLNFYQSFEVQKQQNCIKIAEESKKKQIFNNKQIMLIFGVHNQGANVFKYFQQKQTIEFYLQYGAYDHTYDSSTFYLYSKNWMGINVQDDPIKANRIAVARPQLITINTALNNDNQFKTIQNILTGQQYKSMSSSMSILCQNYFIKRPKYMYLNIKNRQIAALQSNNWKEQICRPQVICIKNNNLDSDVSTTTISNFLQNRNYKQIQKVSQMLWYVDNLAFHYYAFMKSLQKKKNSMKQILHWFQYADIITGTIDKNSQTIPHYQPQKDPIYIQIARTKTISIPDIIDYSNSISQIKYRSILILMYDASKSNVYLGRGQYSMQIIPLKIPLQRATLTKIIIQYEQHKIQIYFFNHYKRYPLYITISDLSPNKLLNLCNSQTITIKQTNSFEQKQKYSKPIDNHQKKQQTNLPQHANEKKQNKQKIQGKQSKNQLIFIFAAITILLALIYFLSQKKSTHEKKLNYTQIETNSNDCQYIP